MRSFGRYVRESDDDEQHRYGHRAAHLVWNDGDLEFLPDPVREDFSSADGIEYHHLDGLDGEHPLVHEYHPDETSRQGKWRDEMSREGHSAVENYKLDSYGINRKLRDESNHLDSHGWNRIGLGRMHQFGKDMDEAASLPQSHPVNLYRGFGRNFPIHNLKPGTEFTDHGYTGGTMNLHTAMRVSHQHESDPEKVDGHDVLLPSELDSHRVPKGHPLDGYRTIGLIHSPAGTRGHLLDHPDYPNVFDDEKEHTLSRGTRFRVGKHVLIPNQKLFGITHPQNIHVVHLHVVGQHPKEITEE